MPAHPPASPNALVDASRTITETEQRLERLLATGWRNARAESAAFKLQAEVLAGFGLETLSRHLNRVAASTAVDDALQSVTLAIAACRLLRARLAGEPDPECQWQPLAPNRKHPPGDRLVPVGRMAVGADEAWACIRLRGSLSAEWYLVDPPTEIEEPVWLRTAITGQLRWRARYALGASLEVQHCWIHGVSEVQPTEAESRALDHARQMLQNPKEGGTLFTGHGGIRLLRLDPADAESYLWTGEESKHAFRGAADRELLGLCWVDRTSGKTQTVIPLTLLEPLGFSNQGAIIHLVPGLPATPLAPRDNLRS